MRQEPSLTFAGALRILGMHEHRKIEKIDKLLGGVILGGGAVAGAIALGVTPLAPVAAVGAIWGWAEQKGLAVELLADAIDAVSGRVSGMQGLEKRELIAAAHSTIVVASVFESARENIGNDLYRKLQISDDEKVYLLGRLASTGAPQDGIKALYAAEIPAPSAARGFEENLVYVAQWQLNLVRYFEEFLHGLAVSENLSLSKDELLTGAIRRYQSHYLGLAKEVPEYALWAQLSEHAATRAAVRELGADADATFTQLTKLVAEVNAELTGSNAEIRKSNADVTTALNANRDALNRVATLLAAVRTRGVNAASAAGSGANTREFRCLGSPELLSA